MRLGHWEKLGARGLGVSTWILTRGRSAGGLVAGSLKLEALGLKLWGNLQIKIMFKLSRTLMGSIPLDAGHLPGGDTLPVVCTFRKVTELSPHAPAKQPQALQSHLWDSLPGKCWAGSEDGTATRGVGSGSWQGTWA